jgi:hypothetical protein
MNSSILDPVISSPGHFVQGPFITYHSAICKNVEEDFVLKPEPVDTFKRCFFRVPTTAQRPMKRSYGSSPM